MSVVTYLLLAVLLHAVLLFSVLFYFSRALRVRLTVPKTEPWDIVEAELFYQLDVLLPVTNQQQERTLFILTAIFPGERGSAGTRMSPFCILLALRVMGLVVTAGAIRHSKLLSNCSHQQTNTQFFYKPDALPVALPTVLKH